MDGKYLADNISPLKGLGRGKAFITINDLLNTERFNKVDLVAYSIRENNLHQDELDRLAFWEPKTVGNVVFNYWD